MDLERMKINIIGAIIIVIIIYGCIYLLVGLLKDIFK